MKVLADGADLECSMGSKWSKLKVSRTNLSFAQDAPLATEQDFQPMTNIAPFGDCKSPRNPKVAAANGAPQPCIPATLPLVPARSSWSGTSSAYLTQELSVLTEQSTCACQWGGVIIPKTTGQDLIEIVVISDADAESPTAPSDQANAQLEEARKAKQQASEEDEQAEKFLYQFRLHDERHERCGLIPYRLELASGQVLCGTTDADGLIKQELPKRRQTASLSYTPLGSQLEVVREVQVVPETATQADYLAHLQNMGFDDAHHQRRILSFQAAHCDLTLTGTLDEKTKSAISAMVTGQMRSGTRG